MAANSKNEVMDAVRKVAGPFLAAFAPSSSVPESFWAALTANESGGDLARGTPPEEIRRREPGVYSHLAGVAAGFESSYGSIHPSDIAQAGALELARLSAPQSSLTNSPTPPDASSVTVRELLAWATSWGFTQIMGYHALEWKLPVEDLRDPGKHYALAAKLMAGFCQQYQLDPASDFEGMARCWNTGRPDGTTYDPQYVTNLLLRMKEW